jgi:hypothetical protein
MMVPPGNRTGVELRANGGAAVLREQAASVGAPADAPDLRLFVHLRTGLETRPEPLLLATASRQDGPVSRRLPALLPAACFLLLPTVPAPSRPPIGSIT